MLKNRDGGKRREVTISDEVWKELRLATYQGMKDKLKASRLILEAGGSVEIAAGLYTFALEEYGKLLILQSSPRVQANSNRIIHYASEFTDHDRKFEIAFDNLQKTRHEYCYVLNDKGGFSPKSFSWRSFTIGLLADTEARLSIFHSDLKEDSEKGIVLQDIPYVLNDYLVRAIEELESVLDATTP
jgi:hypothetical protein